MGKLDGIRVGVVLEVWPSLEVAVCCCMRLNRRVELKKTYDELVKAVETTYVGMISSMTPQDVIGSGGMLARCLHLSNKLKLI